MDEVKWLSNDEQVAWRAWLAVNAQLTARMNRDLQVNNGLSLADYDVLVNLTDVPDRSLRMFELGDKLQWEKSRLSRQVMRMAARGLVERRECLDDRRGAFVDLTPAGLEAIEAAAPEHVTMIRQMLFDAWTPDEVAALTKLYEGVLERLAAKPGDEDAADGSAA
ncbi:MarR family transcriptional regulator [Nocardioides albertanoniae]|uniref:MarR family transcriptional regulator n=1 Tax=Nocardioides albertanoniae TaxID=1175486 RepID=A0A543A7Y1_9ACTN|nr:MarR family transcriptional regulator [Nocardioides albertanoniae]TQL68713.1 MarR family transcriptional regulator [Nocardioides albertanoniae]